MSGARYQGIGASFGSTGPTTAPLPAHIAGDIFFLVEESGAVSAAPDGTWTLVTGSNVSLTNHFGAVYWKRAASSSETDPSIADTGNHQGGFVFSVRGCAPVGVPWDVCVASAMGGLSTSIAIEGGNASSGEDDNDVFYIGLGTAQGIFENVNLTNANLSSVTRRIGTSWVVGNEGAGGLWTGVLPTAGASGTATGTANLSYRGLDICILVKRARPVVVTPDTATVTITTFAPTVTATVATKLYLPSTGAAAESPAYRPGWEDTTSLTPTDRPLVPTTPSSTAMTTLSYEHNNLADADTLMYRAVSPPLDGDQEIAAQTIQLVIRGQESDGGANQFVAWAIYVVSNDGGTVRGVIQDVARDNTELATAALTNRHLSATGTAVSALNGDRIVVELGVGGDAVGIGAIVSLRVGDNGGSDLPLSDGSTNDHNPYVRFAQELFFAEEGGGDDVIVTPTTATVTITTFAPTVQTPRVVTPTTATITVTTFAPTVLAPRVVTPPTATVTITTFAPTVQTPRVVTPTTATITVTTFAPTVTATNSIVVTPGTASLTVTTFAPTVTATNSVTVTPLTATLTITTFAPTVTATNSIVVTPGTASLTITTFAPTARIGIVVTPLPGAIILTTFAPIIVTPVRVVPGPGSIVLTTYPPKVVATINPIAEPWVKNLDDSYFTGPNENQDHWRKMYDDSYWRLIP